MSLSESITVNEIVSIYIQAWLWQIYEIWQRICEDYFMSRRRRRRYRERGIHTCGANWERNPRDPFGNEWMRWDRGVTKQGNREEEEEEEETSPTSKTILECLGRKK